MPQVFSLANIISEPHIPFELGINVLLLMNPKVMYEEFVSQVIDLVEASVVRVRFS
jgi:hypothetical protein